MAQRTPNLPLRCVVLRHEGVEEPHYDVLFEISPGSPLATWRASRWPIAPGDHAVRAADHRPAYLTYEGPISGDRGHVRRVFEDPACRVCLQEGHLEVTFGDGTELLMTKDSPDAWFCWIDRGRVRR